MRIETITRIKKKSYRLFIGNIINIYIYIYIYIYMYIYYSFGSIIWFHIDSKHNFYFNLSFRVYPVNIVMK